MNLKSMSVDKLVDLRKRVEAALGTKVTEARRALESKLAKLGRGFRRGGAGVPGKVAPKYRNPDNPSETWAGRGLQPRWLAAALKSGKKLEHFAIAAPARAALKKSPKRHAYALARYNAGAPGVDGVTFAQIKEQGLEAWLAGLREELVSKTYRPQPADSDLIRPGVPT